MPPVTAADLDAVFPAAESLAPAPSAEEVVRASFANLFDFDGVVRIESTRTPAGGEAQRSRSSLYRKRFEGSVQRVLIVARELDPPGPGMRLLEVTDASGPQRARLFAPRITPTPVPTQYRITDPFLGSFSDRPPGEDRADLSSLVRAYEIIGREPGTLDGEIVDRITLRPRGSRGVEQVELWIARDAPVILEYRYFEGGSAEPARIVRVPRDAMLEFEGRLLPGEMLYDDRIDGTLTRLRVGYETLSSSLGDAPFMESTFHRVSLPGDDG